MSDTSRARDVQGQEQGALGEPGAANGLCTREGQIEPYCCLSNPRAGVSSASMSDHPEDTCQKCGGPNITWFVNNSQWNRVVLHRWSILCPICFVREAEAIGIRATAWKLVPENYQSSGSK